MADTAASPTEFSSAVGRATLLSIHGVGPKTFRILVEELACRGLAFAGD
ncbi:hypothetical protein [Phenylobacterium sp.]